MKQRPVRNQILDHAQMLVQTRGYNAMSYRDLATVIGVKTSSIHYYFPKKESLALALIRRYREAFKGALADIDAEVTDTRLKIQRYVSLFTSTVRSGRICLGGMLATDLTTLPVSIQDEVRGFYAENETWLSNLLGTGRETGQLKFEGSPKVKAETLFAALEGIMVASRLFQDEGRLLNAEDWIQGTLS
jgi:TetR/AcrR family transcriptional repressor of nem operon